VVVVIEPVFVVGAPRSGVRLVYEALSDCRGVFSREGPLGDPLADLLAEVPSLDPAARGWDSDCLLGAAPEVAERCRALFGEHLRDREDLVPDDAPGSGVVPTLECSLTHALRVPFLAQVFPEARFIVVERDAASAVSSLAEAWGSGRFVTYPSLPGWTGLPWSFPLVEGWRELIGAELLEVATRQWSSIAGQLRTDVASLSATEVVQVDLGGFLGDPAGEVQRIGDQLGWVVDRPLPSPLPLTRSTVSPPAKDKWRKANPVLGSLVEPVGAESGRSGPTGEGGSAGEASFEGSEPAPAGTTMRSLFESNFTLSVLGLLADSACSLLVSTYQSGRLISLRQEDGRLNTHFVVFDSPMGVACSRSNLVVATRRQIHEHQTHAGAARVLSPAGSHDACYLPRNTHVTGDMGVHEIVLAEDGLWAVCTRFSCLASFDALHSFVPRWTPGFVTRLAAEDRCHLNGVAVRDGRVRYVSAFGQTDEPSGWRQGKGTSGVVIDVVDGEVIAEGLAMPHSPRFYDGHVWVLESGNGSLARVNPAGGTIETVATLPGFTRGLAFSGRTAWVGLSRARDTGFRGLAVTARADRACGVWAVNIDTGETLGWVRFEGIVQEIFDVQLCPWRHPGISEVGDEVVGESFTLP
jgi:uncharacterized protein (TIGR03032 family)